MNDTLITLVHSSPLGSLEIPGIGVVEPATPFDVPKALAESLLEQTDLYAVVDGKRRGRKADADEAIEPTPDEDDEDPTATPEGENP